MKKKYCIVFDLDDTLYMERDYVRSGFYAVGKHLSMRYGIKGFASLAWKEYECGKRGDIFNRVLDHIGYKKNKKIISELVEVYRAHEPSIVLEPDAVECLAKLREKAFIAIITDGPMTSQKRKVEALFLDCMVDKVIYTAMLGEGKEKPATDSFELAQKAAKTTSDMCAYIGDNPNKDFEGPLTMGWRAIRIRRVGAHHCAIECNIPGIVEMGWLDYKKILNHIIVAKK